MRRRDFLPALAAPFALAQAQTPQPVKLKGRMKQGVTRGVFGRGMSLEDSCREAAESCRRGVAANAAHARQASVPIGTAEAVRAGGRSSQREVTGPAPRPRCNAGR